MSHNTSIAEAVLGVNSEQQGYEAAIQAYHTLTGEPIDAQQMKDAVSYIATPAPARPSMQTMPTDHYEWLITVASSHELFVSQAPRQSNVLVDWPIYSELMKRHGQPADGSASALLLGCRTALSAKAFTVLAREEYGANQPYIVDLETGAHKRRLGNFVLGDAMRLPFASGSMDFVQTDQLFHQLRDPKGPNGHTQTLPNLERLLGEVDRVLAPGGQMLLYEQPPRFSESSYLFTSPLMEAAALTVFVQDQLDTAGLTNVEADVPEAFLSADFARDPSRNFDAHDKAMTAAVAFYARKPA